MVDGETICPKCGARLKDVISCGYVGCAFCYITFGQYIEEYLTKLCYDARKN